MALLLIGAWSQLNNAPFTRRAYHSSVTDSSGNIYVIAGGSNTTYYTDIWRFVPASNLWTQLSNPPATFTARAFHTSVLDPRTNIIYTIGGNTLANTQLSDVWSYSIPKGNFLVFYLIFKTLKFLVFLQLSYFCVLDSWQVFNTTGLFSKRNSHNSVINPSIGISYTIAGTNGTSNYLNLHDVVALDFPSKKPNYYFIIYHKIINTFVLYTFLSGQLTHIIFLISV